MSSYFGSKAAAGLCQSIIAMMPPHDTFIETHLGGGAIMKRKASAINNIGIDLDPQALSGFSCDYPVQLVNGCAHHFLMQYEFNGAELNYCDPPYLIQTRSSHRQYRFDYIETNHIELIALLKSLSCHIILSGYPQALYDDLLGDWQTIELQAMTRGGVRTEKLWFNYTIDRVHWPLYSGKTTTRGHFRSTYRAITLRTRHQSLCAESINCTDDIAQQDTKVDQNTDWHGYF